MKRKLHKKVKRNALLHNPRVTRAAAKCQRLEKEEAVAKESEAEQLYFSDHFNLRAYLSFIFFLISGKS
jgi:hypothetical protein